jgi:hypothetical protein
MWPAVQLELGSPADRARLLDLGAHWGGRLSPEQMVAREHWVVQHSAFQYSVYSLLEAGKHLASCEAYRAPAVLRQQGGELLDCSVL